MWYRTNRKMIHESEIYLDSYISDSVNFSELDEEKQDVENSSIWYIWK